MPGVDDPQRFHEGWEARVFGLGRNLRHLYSVDEFRHAMERLNPAQYRELTYFEKWLAGMEHLVVARGYVSQDELDAAQRRRLAEHDHVHAHEAPTIAPHPDEHLEAPGATERFAAGDAVLLVEGLGEHHRLPDWARGHRGTVRAVRGRFPLPDLIVSGGDAGRRYALYSVELAAADVFAGAGAEDTLHLDVYDPYLQPAEEGER